MVIVQKATVNLLNFTISVLRTSMLLVMVGPSWRRIYLNIPPVTKAYIGATILVTLACNLELISEYNILFHPDLIIERFQVWRLVTPFLYLGQFKACTPFYLLCRYCNSRDMEKNSFYGRQADYLFMLLLMGSIIIFMAIPMTNLYFFGETLNYTLLCLWSRKNGFGNVPFFLFVLQSAAFVVDKLVDAPVSGELYSSLIAYHASHLYFFLEEVFPKKPLGFRILKTPRFLKALFNEEEDEAVDEARYNQVGDDDDH